MLSLRKKYFITTFILLYYALCISSHSFISSLHLIEHLLEHDHYHLDEFHNIADDSLNNENHHTHGLLIDTFLSQANENESAEDFDEVLLQILKLNLHIQGNSIIDHTYLSIQGDSILVNRFLHSQNHSEPLVPPPQHPYS
jgi:hypothetical protein